MGDFRERKDIYNRPRKKAAFFNFIPEREIARNRREYSTIRDIVRHFCEVLPAINREYKGGSKKNFEEGQKQRKEFLRNLITNFISISRKGATTLKIPVKSTYWSSLHKSKKTIINYSAVQAVLNNMVDLNYATITSMDSEKDGQVRTYVPSDSFILFVYNTNNDLLKYKLPKTRATARKHSKNWTNIHLKSFDKKTRQYISNPNSDELLLSLQIMKKHKANKQKTLETVRITKKDWFSLSVSKRSYIRTLINSDYLVPLNPVTVNTSLRLFPNLVWGKQTLSPLKRNNNIKKDVKNNNKETISEIVSPETPEYVDIPWIEVAMTWEDMDEDSVFGNAVAPEYMEYEIRNNEMFRVFNGDFSHGGRYYGSVVQNLPRELRKFIHVRVGNRDVKMVELDYAQLHPTVIGVKTGKRVVTNPYGYCTGQGRTERKIALLVMLNAEDRKSAVKAIRSHFVNEFDYKKGSEKLSETYIGKLFDEISSLNKDIAESFFTGEGARLQAIDSSMATRIMAEYMKKYPEDIIECIHDSFMVPAGKEQYLKELMIKHFQGVLNTDTVPVIKVA